MSTQKQIKIFNFWHKHGGTMQTLAKKFKTTSGYASRCISVCLSENSSEFGKEPNLDYDIETDINGIKIIDYRHPFIETYETK